MDSPLRCPHCGKVDWSRAPRARQIFGFVRASHTDVTSRQVADRFGLSIANASNFLARLSALGFITRGEWPEPNPTGGVYHTYRAILEP